MKRFTRRLVAMLFSVCLLFGCVMPASAYLQVNDSVYTSTELQIDTATQKFVIMQVADIRAGDKPDSLLIAMLKTAVKSIKPDLVVFTGNLIDLSLFDNEYDVPKIDIVRDSLGQIFDVLDHNAVPFAVAFGQTEFSPEVTKEGLLIFCQTYNGCIISNDDDDAPGVNFYKTIYANGAVKNCYNLWFLDSLCSQDLTDDVEEVGISEAQIEWYQKYSSILAKKNDKKPLQSIIFMNSSVAKNSNFIKAASKQGDVQAMVFGNSTTSKDDTYSGIKLLTTAGIGFNIRNKGRCVRVITIDNNDGASCSSEVKTFSDIFRYNVLAYIRFFYTACETYIIAWVLTGLIGAALIALLIRAIVRKSKDKKAEKVEERKMQGKNPKKSNGKKRKGKKK